MKTLLISNYLLPEHLNSIISSRWTESHPSLADFQCVVLDMKLDTISPLVISDIPTVHYKGFPFYVLFDDINKLLQSGGVVICLNYYTFANRYSIFTESHSRTHKAIYGKRISTYSYEYKYQGAYETSYDWLDLGLLKCTEVDRLNAMSGSQFKVISAIDVVKYYFAHVKEYHKTIHGIEDSSIAGIHYVGWVYRRDPSYERATYTRDEVEILAVTEVTNEPVAVAMKYRGFPGMLIFLPTYDLPIIDQARKDTINTIVWNLHRLGEYYYKQSQRERGVKLEQPSWLLDYRVKPAKDADEKLSDIEKTKNLLLIERDRYDRMPTLINGYGKPLENVVKEFFSKEWLGFNVENTEIGAPIDMFVKNGKTGKALAIQVTGVAGSFNQKDKHFGALMNYLPEHIEKITNGQAERIVLIVNTYRDTPLEDRDKNNDISKTVQDLIKRNDFCLIRSHDLYKLWSLWVESPEKISADNIFDQLFECKGLWQH